MSAEEIMGFGRRSNGTCLSTENDCGPTRRDQHACCPLNTFCDGDDNTVCCPDQTEDCTDALLETPRCADSGWIMYNNTAPFCCEPTVVAAFSTDEDSNICADAGFHPVEGDVPLQIIPQSGIDTSIPSNSLGTPGAPLNSIEATSTFDAANAGTDGARPEGVEAARPASNNIGPIVGGVVGGVLGLALIIFLLWFLRRKRKRQNGLQQESGPPPFVSVSEKDATPNAAIGKYEKDATSRTPDVNELDGTLDARPSPHQREGERAELN